MRHINFFLGAQNGVFRVGAKKFMLKNFMCFFCSLVHAHSGEIPGKVQCHAEGGATKGGVSKCEQTQTNADKRRQTLRTRRPGKEKVFQKLPNWLPRLEKKRFWPLHKKRFKKGLFVACLPPKIAEVAPMLTTACREKGNVCTNIMQKVFRMQRRNHHASPVSAPLILK